MDNAKEMKSKKCFGRLYKASSKKHNTTECYDVTACLFDDMDQIGVTEILYTSDLLKSRVAFTCKKDLEQRLVANRIIEIVASMLPWSAYKEAVNNADVENPSISDACGLSGIGAMNSPNAEC